MRTSGLCRARSATTLEVALIVLVMFCLPLFEAPKNIFSALFLVAWGGYAIRGGGLGRASPFDVPIAGLAAILWIAPVFSDFAAIITPLSSAPRWTLLALCVLAASRLDYSYGQVVSIFAALMVGGVAAVAESLWMWNLNGNAYPEFRSVGHVNHSSMYSLITLGVGIASLYLYSRWLKVLGVVAIVSTLAFLLPSKSLVGGVAVIVILVIGVGVARARYWSFRGVVTYLCALTIAVLGVLATPPAAGFRDELVSRITGENIFSNRDKILNSAMAVWDRHPLFGSGWSSFGVATSEERVRRALEDRGVDYDGADYAHKSHGHNLWLTILIERGLLGVGMVSILLLFYYSAFLPLALNRERLNRSDRGVALAALLTAVGFTTAGLGNTTMMNEHGHAGMLLISISYGYLRGRGQIRAR